MFKFAWDPAKAASNLRKHKVSFDLAREVFEDPLSVSEIDDDRRGFEERWITMGCTRADRLLVVCHNLCSERREHQLGTANLGSIGHS